MYVSYSGTNGTFKSISGSGSTSTIKPIVNGTVQTNSTTYTNQLLSIEIKSYGINYYINSTIFYTIPAVSLTNYNAYFNLYSINDSISSINYGNSSTTNYFNSLSVSSTGIYLGQNVGTNGAVNIGYNAGQTNQGTGSIAIGYNAGPTGMSSNSIALNASGTPLSATGPTGGFYVAPIASYSGSQGPFSILAYGADKQIVTVTGATGLNLSLSTQTVTYDSWLLANFINSPPPPVLIGSVSEATDFFLIFSYPIQYEFGLMNTLIPCISNAVLTIGGNSTQLSKQNTFVYNYTKTNLSDNIVQCLHFYKGTSTYTSNKYKYNGVDYYMDHYGNVPHSSSIEFYYTNHSSSSYFKL